MRRRRLGSVDVGEGDKKPIGEAEYQTSNIYGSFVLSGDLDNAGNSVEHACRPESRFAAVEMRKHAGR